MKFLDIATVVSMGWLVGIEFAVSAFINPILWQLEASAQEHAVRLFAQRLGKVMPFWYGAVLALLGSEALLRHAQRGFTLLMAAAVLWAAIMLLSVLILVPINNRLARAGIPATAEARHQHRRWDLLHRGRVLALAASMLASLSAILP